MKYLTILSFKNGCFQQMRSTSTGQAWLTTSTASPQNQTKQHLPDVDQGFQHAVQLVVRARARSVVCLFSSIHVTPRCSRRGTPVGLGATTSVRTRIAGSVNWGLGMGPQARAAWSIDFTAEYVHKFTKATGFQHSKKCGNSFCQRIAGTYGGREG